MDQLQIRPEHPQDPAPWARSGRAGAEYAKGTPTPIDESRSHSRKLGADAIEGVIGDKEHLINADPDDLRRFR
jgi:hypothetical protein